MRSKQVDIAPILNKETLLVYIAYHFIPQLPFLLPLLHIDANVSVQSIFLHLTAALEKNLLN
jgi:hypothetical protein